MPFFIFNSFFFAIYSADYKCYKNKYMFYSMFFPKNILQIIKKYLPLHPLKSDRAKKTSE